MNRNSICVYWGSSNGSQPACREAARALGRRFAAEGITIVPRIIKRVIVRPRYVKNQRFTLAPLPPQPIEQSMAGARLVTQIAL